MMMSDDEREESGDEAAVSDGVLDETEDGEFGWGDEDDDKEETEEVDEKSGW